MKKIISELGDRGLKSRTASGGQSSSDFARVDPRRVDYDTANGIGYPKKTVSNTNSGPHGVNKLKDKPYVNVVPNTQTVNYDPFGNEIKDAGKSTGPVDDIDSKEVEAPVNAPKVKQPSQEVINAITQDQIQRILKLAGQAEMPKVIDDDESVRSNFHYDHAPEKRETEKQNIDLEIPLSKVELPIAKVGQVIAGDDDANAEWERLHPSNESLDRIKKLSGLK